MYFNDVNVGFYLLVAVIGLFVGQIVDWANERLPEYKKVFSKDIIKKYKMEFKPNYILMITTAILYVFILYTYGIQKTFIGNLNLIKYMLLTPMLLSAFVIDYRLQIIPNRLNLVMFEIGLVIAFIFGMSNVAITIDMLLGMLAGGGIFLLITIIGGLIYGREAMGLGDVKLMGALGLYFGFSNIISIALIAFLLGAIIGVIIIVTKLKKSDEYIPFGPFIVIAAFINIFIPFEWILLVLLKIFTLGMYQG